jgi:hypothetical protein
MPGRIKSVRLMNAREWITAYAGHLGTDPPTSEEWSQLLDLAAVAAHASERVAAPVACWVAAQAGVAPQAALEAARDISPSES